MKRKYRRDPNYPVGKLTVVPDFLPPPEDLLPPNTKLKVTIELDWDSVEFFKSQAKRHHSKYQRMMREVLRRVLERHALQVSDRYGQARAQARPDGDQHGRRQHGADAHA